MQRVKIRYSQTDSNFKALENRGPFVEITNSFFKVSKVSVEETKPVEEVKLLEEVKPPEETKLLEVIGSHPSIRFSEMVKIMNSQATELRWLLDKLLQERKIERMKGRYYLRDVD